MTRSPCASCSAPAFSTWATTIDREVDFGATDGQIYFMWRMRERTPGGARAGALNAGKLFSRVKRELEEENVATYPAGPWNAGLEPFPDSGPARSGSVGSTGSSPDAQSS